MTVGQCIECSGVELITVGQWGGANDRGQSIECSGVELMTVGQCMSAVGWS